MRLTETGIDQTVRISDLAGAHALVRKRLSDLGIIEGTMVCMKKYLPFKGPCTIDAGGLWIALRHREANRILVEDVC
ncbi:ferrous iron transport protein A [Paenibacillus sp. SI8]|uniref:FeoA family protein n=1 Tax=unclassified Paenibacillus TaxID=185978 RepID=UPI00346685F1